MANTQIAESTSVSVIWVKKLWSRYRNCTGTITYPLRWTGRRMACLTAGNTAVLSARGRRRRRAVRAEKSIEQSTGIHIPHNIIHGIMMENNLAERNPKKSQRCKWVHYKRTYSNLMWRTDYKQLRDGK